MIKVVESDDDLQLAYLAPKSVDDLMSEVATVSDVIDFLISIGVISDEPYVFQLIESKLPKIRLRRLIR